MSTTIASLAIQISANAGQLSAQINQANQSLHSLEESTKRVDRSINSTGSSFSGLTNQLARFISVAAGVGALTWAVKQASEAEQAQMAFKTMLGSAEDAKDMIAELRDFAARTPLEFAGLQQNAVTLMQFGVESEKVLPILQILGDVSLGNAEKMQSMTLAFAQMSAAGKMQGQDLLQMVNAGFSPLQEISQRTGISMLELKKRMEAGALSTNLITNAFISATAEGGRFFGSMDNAADTFSGKLGKLKEEINQTGIAIGEQLNAGLKEAIEGISLFNAQSQEASNAISESWELVGYTIGNTVKFILFSFRLAQSGLIYAQVAFVDAAIAISEAFSGVRNESLRMLSEGIIAEGNKVYQMALDIRDGVEKQDNGNSNALDGEKARKAMIDELAAAQKKANDELERWKNKAGDIARSVDPLVEYTEKVKELQQAMALGGLTQEHYAAALEEAQQSLFKATQPERRDRRVTIASALSSGSSEMANFLAEATNRDARRNEQAQALEEQKRQTALLAQAVQLLGETPVLASTDIE